MKRWILTPWRWPRWLLALLAVASTAGYFLSAVPLMRISEEHGRSRASLDLLANFYLPVALCIEHVPLAETIAEWQSRFMDGIYGPPGVTTDRIEDVIDLF